MKTEKWREVEKTKHRDICMLREDGLMAGERVFKRSFTL